MAFQRWLCWMDLLPLVSFVICAPFCRFKTRTGSPGKTTGGNQKVGPQFSDPWLWKDGLCGPGITFFASHSCWQGHGEQFSFTKRFVMFFFPESAGGCPAREGLLGRWGEVHLRFQGRVARYEVEGEVGFRGHNHTGSRATVALCNMSAWVARSVATLKSWRFSGKVDLLMLAVIHSHVGKWKKKKESGLSAVLPWRLTTVNPDSACHENEPISGTRCFHTQPTKTSRAALHARKTGPGRLGCPLTRPRGCRFQRWHLASLMTST